MHVGKSLCQLNYTSRSNRSVFLSSCAVSNLHGAVVGIPKEFPRRQEAMYRIINGVSAFDTGYLSKGLETQI